MFLHFLFYIMTTIWFWKEKRRLSRSEITTGVPAQNAERGRRMSRHDAFALTATNQSSSDHHKSRVSSKDEIRIIYVFLIESDSLHSNVFIHSDKIMNGFIIM